MTRRVVGCMTGTSLDGIDAALVEIEGSGLAMRPRLIRGVSRDLGAALDALRRLADQQALRAGEIAAAMGEFANVHVRAIRELLAGEPCDLICVHGQTVYHKPPHSWQLMQPAPIAREFGVPVVFDLRAMDLAAGGQGAPITPLSDRIVWGASGAAIVNLGGFCNITVLPRSSGDAAPFSQGEMDQISAMDVCPCNHVLDSIARKLWCIPYDEGGERALRGNPHHEALEDLEGIFTSQSGLGRSLGTGDESLEWISRWRAHVDGADLAATACEAIAACISTRARAASMFWLAGGGARNAAIVRALRGHRTEQVEVLPGDLATYREAMSFAVLGALCQDRTPITLPKVTGVPAPAPISGAWVLP